MSGLQHLLEQTDRPGSSLVMVGPRIFTLEQQRDPARLLIDMAALVVDQGKFIDFDATPNLSERYGALLARFAELDRRAAQ